MNAIRWRDTTSTRIEKLRSGYRLPVRQIQTRYSLSCFCGGQSWGSTRLTPAVGVPLGRYPELDVVIDDLASIRPDQPELLVNLLSLAQYPRVYVKVSHTWNISDEAYLYRDTWE